jgi:PLP dependent protein
VSIDIARNIQHFQDRLAGTDCRLVVVSKTYPVTTVQAAYDAGARIFGENRAQELAEKAAALPSDIEWHLIGQLQTNKVKFVAPWVHVVESIDSLKLLLTLERHAAAHNRRIAGLLQFHIGQEDTKTGLTWNEAISIVESPEFMLLQHVHLTGVMGIASNTNDQGQIKREFVQLHDYFLDLRARYFAEDDQFCEISMGMSQDWPLALAAGSSLIRVGSGIFGARSYR